MKDKKRFSLKRISLKWKIFAYLLIFTAILLAFLWIFQVANLELFYKSTKERELEAVTEQVTALVGAGSDSQETYDAISEIAEKYSVSILVADKQGNELYLTKNNLNSVINRMTIFDILAYAELSEASESGVYETHYVGRGWASTFQSAFDIRGNETVSDMPERMEDFIYAGGDKSQHRFELHIEPIDNSVEGIVRVITVSREGGSNYIFINSILTPVDATVNTIKIQLVYISIFLALVSLIVAFLISRQVSASIIKVNDSAKKLAKGDYDVSFNGNDYSEIAQLSDTLNVAAAELSKAENLQRELIANVSHDLRTPLTMIIGYSEAMRDLPGENTPENIQAVIDEAERLNELVNDLLDVSRIQSGVAGFEPRVYDVTTSIRKVIERYSKLISTEGYNIVFESSENALVFADEQKMFQVIYNLVNNAINYAGDDKTVIVRQVVLGDNAEHINEGAKHIRIEVEDHGVGIEESMLNNVWQRYYKIDKSHKRAVRGTGLGLSIVENIMKLHGTRYGVNSKPGKGSTFWVEL